MGYGRSAGGAARWIQLGPINIQPAEIAKVALILWLAYSLSKKRLQIRSFTVGFLPHALVAGLLMMLCLKQPDFGSAVMIGLLTFILLFSAGAKTGYLLGSMLFAAPVAYALIASSEYRMRRIQAFIDPFAHRYDVGYQISESLMSFGSGGATGVGIGDSRQKLFFLPEAHTDFISAIIGEELGFVGVVTLLAVFVLVVVRGLRAAFRAADDYGAYLAVGITMFVGAQAITNLAVAMGMLPTKGLVLPFVSYGGSSLIVNCAAVGILLNVSRPREAPDGAVEPSTDESAREKDRPKRKSKRDRVHGRALEGGTA
jgi:cell division protein FtsW